MEQDFETRVRETDIENETSISIKMIAKIIKESPECDSFTIKEGNKLFKEQYIQIRNKVLALVPWSIRPHVLYRVNKYYQHIL